LRHCLRAGWTKVDRPIATTPPPPDADTTILKTVPSYQIGTSKPFEHCAEVGSVEPSACLIDFAPRVSILIVVAVPPVHDVLTFQKTTIPVV